jgi:hypothetical protein
MFLNLGPTQNLYQVNESFRIANIVKIVQGCHG